MQIAHCRGNYYREFAFKTLPGESKLDLLRLKLTPVRKDTDLTALLSAYKTRKGHYISVYSFSNLTEEGTIVYNSAKINRIYFDFDNKETPQKAIDEAVLMAKVLNRHNIRCHCYFSGGKGIALYIEFQTVDIAPENKKEVLVKFFDLILETVKLDYENFLGMWIPNTNTGFDFTLYTIDYQVRGDIARVSRLPNTHHSSGSYCIPVTFGDMRKGLKHIKHLAQQPRGDYDLDDVIIENILWNETMPVIIKNLEKEVIAERTHNEKINVQKKRYHKLQSKIQNNGAITDTDIEKAKSVSISSVISSEKKIVCPFHIDHDPSLSINHKKGLWYCFGCGKGGTVIDFVMEKEGLDFVSAVRRLIS
jgi:hypothetical protein